MRTALSMSSWRAPTALALLLLSIVGPIVQEYTAQTASRYTLSAALVEHHTIELDRYEANVFVDRLERNGHVYSDKAPGQPFLSTPAYATARAVGAEPATVVRLRGNLGVWFVTFWSSLVPALALVLLMAAAAAPLGDRAALVGAAGVAFGTLVLPFSAQLYGHLLGATLAFGAWRLLRARPPTWQRAVAAGLLVGVAVTVEYPLALVGAAAGIWLLLRHRALIVPYVLGGIPAGAALLTYQWVLLGSPFSSPYSDKAVHHGTSPLITGAPKPLQLLEVLVGSRGILLFTPIVAAGAWGLWRLARRRGPLRDDAIVGLCVLGAFLLLQAGWSNPWGGEMPGPRYMIPALPFLAVGIAEAWNEQARLVRVLLVISIASMAWPLVARHLVPDHGWLIASQLTDVKVAGFMPTLFTMAVGWLGWVVHALVVTQAALHLERTAGGLPPADGPSRAGEGDR